MQKLKVSRIIDALVEYYKRGGLCKTVLQRSLLFDAYNRLRYGREAPLYCEQVWVDPKNVKQHIYKHGGMGPTSGLVIGEWPPMIDCLTELVCENTVVKSCIDHWKNGVDWQDTDDYKSKLKYLTDNGSVWNECRNEKDLLKSYDNLDSVFTQVKKDGRLKTRKELNSNSFREKGTFSIHIDPEGSLWLGAGGYHRFAIALVLELEMVPARIGLVHKDAIPLLSTFRNLEAERM
ncbi:hypothetical protein N8491_02270 [Akkermansiaceae bacterium]|nr:hypothetical protein [Akkermansiaceae bacterium]MDB4695328.1 hypothetical protein [Akkermansiaceae bacterium]